MKPSLLLSQILTVAAATFLVLAPRFSAEHVLAGLFAVGLGCLLRADYARRPRSLVLAAAPATRAEPLTLAA